MFALTGAATQHMEVGNMDMAIKRIDEAMDLIIKTKAKRPDATLFAAGNILRKLDGDKATEYLTRLLSVAKDHPELQKGIFDALGTHLAQSGNTVMAIEAFHAYVGVVKKMNPGSREEVSALYDFGSACVDGQLYKLAMPALAQARQLADKLNDEGMAVAITSRLAHAFLQERRPEETLALVSQEIERTGENSFTAQLKFLAILAHLHQRDFEKARQHCLQTAAKAADDMTKATATNFRSVIDQTEGNLDDAIAGHQQSLQLKFAELHPSVVNQVRGTLEYSDVVPIANCYLQKKELENATKYIQRSQQALLGIEQNAAAAVKSGIRQQDESNLMSANHHVAVSELTQKLLVARKQYEQALVAAESGRASAQKRLMAQRLGIDRGRSQRAESMSIDEIRALAKELNSTLVYFSLISRLDLPSRSLLGVDGPFHHPSHIYTWVVSPAGRITFRQTPIDVSLGRLVQQYRDDLLAPKQVQKDASGRPAKNEAKQQTKQSGSQPEEQSKAAPRSDPGSAGRKLHDLLFGAVNEWLPTDPEERVTIIPQGPLFLVPFAALTDSESRTLIQRHTLLTAPSLGVLKLSAELPSAGVDPKQVLIVGNPEMPAYKSLPGVEGSKLDPLPGAELEAKLIGQLLQTKPLIGKEATEKAVRQRMEEASVIHLASHGLLEAGNAYAKSYLSAIALAPNEGDNGFLTVREVATMKLKANLVVLSACDSGRGLITGDGVLGLSRALHIIRGTIRGRFLVARFRSCHSSPDDDLLSTVVIGPG